MSKDTIQAIAFDFGNTLCPWDEEQYWHVTHSTVREICAHSPDSDFDSALEIFMRIRREGYSRNLPRLRENDLVHILGRTAEEVCGAPLCKADLQGIVSGHVASFAEVCKAPDGLHDLLDRLSRRYKLAVASNYPLAECIRRALSKLEIDKYFQATVVSGDLGVIKPSKLVFDKVVSDLSLPREKVLFVGDDWVADVVGAHISGLPCLQIANTDNRRKPRSLGGLFGAYFDKALKSPELKGWQEARPLAVLNSVLELEAWLEAIRA